MSQSDFEGITPAPAEGVSRRGSLAAVGGAALLASLANVGVSAAKKKKKNCKKKQKQRCNNDTDACQAQIPAACEGDPGCIALATLCCQQCSANGFLTCLLLNQNGAAAVARLR